jgi:hypothetical protein
MILYLFILILFGELEEVLGKYNKTVGALVIQLCIHSRNADRKTQGSNLPLKRHSVLYKFSSNWIGESIPQC